MVVIGRRDDDAIDLGIGDDFAPVTERAGVFVLALGRSDSTWIDIAQRVDLFTCHTAEIRPAAPANANDGQAKFFLGRHCRFGTMHGG